jgi:phospholipid/cholesterol/gamma-HCH transport system substrate-binding protein
VASIGSDGLMGDKVLTISSYSFDKNIVKDNDLIASKSPIEMEDIMRSVKTSVDNVGIISAQLAQFSYKMNNGNGALTKLISDEEFSNSLKNTITNLQNSSSQFAIFTTKMNDGKGALSNLISDEKFGKSLDSTMMNLQTSTKGLSENMEAAKHNILLKGFFKKKKRAEEKKIAELKKLEIKKKNEQLKGIKDGAKMNMPANFIPAKDSIKIILSCIYL